MAAGASPLLVPREEIRRVAHIVIAGDRGLCGAYNTSVIRTAERSILEQQRLGRDYSLVLVGRKAEGYFRYRGYRIDAVFTGFSDRPAYENARDVGGAATEAFVGGDTDLVEIVYTRFVTVGTQVVTQADVDAPLPRRDRRPHRHRPVGTARGVRVRAVDRGNSRPPAAALRRLPRLRRPARTVPRRSTRPASAP